jgi:isopenicillin N synthase-like dioxygenase
VSAGSDVHWPIIQEASVAQTSKSSADAGSFIPVIDIAPYLAGTPEGKRRVAEQLGRACREIGFYVIVGHGVDPALIEEVEAVSREFFDLPCASPGAIAKVS